MNRIDRMEEEIKDSLSMMTGRLDYNGVCIIRRNGRYELTIHMEVYEDGKYEYIGDLVENYDSLDDIPLSWTWDYGERTEDEFGIVHYDIVFSHC